MKIAFIAEAPTGRSKCRVCRASIDKGELRLGHSVPNPYAEGEATLWFHLRCGAAKCPALLQQAWQPEAEPPEGSRPRELERLCQLAEKHPELTRLSDVERAKTGRARCRHCKQLIDKDQIRLGLSSLQEGALSAEGYLHWHCAQSQFPAAVLVSYLRERGPRTLGGVWDPELLGLLDASASGEQGGDPTPPRVPL